ncbi:uncharacterized protein LOC120475684 isoform X2 [Pimephales promelas]|nr:uncharacterized protein LOC120475684 isoform X2 [Pimephales promelas]
MKGDSVTLHPYTVIPAGDSAEWWFGGEFIAKINKADGLFSTSEGDDGRFKCKLNLDKQTGSLTITNITPDNAGLYKLQIMSTTETSKIFSVTVTDNVVSVSVVEGNNVTLRTGVTDIQGDDLIVWKFEDQVIPIPRSNDPVVNEWRNIYLNGRTGDLTISNIRNDQSGNYEVTTRSMILHKTFHIAVEIPEGFAFSSVGTGIGIGIGIMIGIGILIGIAIMAMGVKLGCLKVA